MTFIHIKGKRMKDQHVNVNTVMFQNRKEISNPILAIEIMPLTYVGQAFQSSFTSLGSF